MKSVGKRLSYGNVVATIALFLALTGGTVWAANKITSKQIGKGAVKNKNLAKNAVKNKNLAKNAVSSPKIAKNGVKGDDIADGVVTAAKLAPGYQIVATATVGPLAVNESGFRNLPLNPPLTVIPVAGEPMTASVEARGTLANNGTEDCRVTLLPTVNGNPMVIGELLSLSGPDDSPGTPFPNGIPVAAGSFPVGITQPGIAQSIGISLNGDTGCASSSRVDQLVVVVTRAK